MALLDSPFSLSTEQQALVDRHNAAVAAIASASPFPLGTDIMIAFARDIATIAGARKILADNLMVEVQVLSQSTTNTVLQSGQNAMLQIAETRRRQLEDYSSPTALPFGLNLLTVEFTP